MRLALLALLLTPGCATSPAPLPAGDFIVCVRDDSGVDCLASQGGVARRLTLPQPDPDEPQALGSTDKGGA